MLQRLEKHILGIKTKQKNYRLRISLMNTDAKVHNKMLVNATTFIHDGSSRHVGKEGNVLNMIKNNYRKPLANILIVTDRILSPLISGRKKIVAITPSTR